MWCYCFSQQSQPTSPRSLVIPSPTLQLSTVITPCPPTSRLSILRSTSMTPSPPTSRLSIVSTSNTPSPGTSRFDSQSPSPMTPTSSSIIKLTTKPPTAHTINTFNLHSLIELISFDQAAKPCYSATQESVFKNIKNDI